MLKRKTWRSAPALGGINLSALAQSLLETATRGPVTRGPNSGYSRGVQTFPLDEIDTKSIAAGLAEAILCFSAVRSKHKYAVVLMKWLYYAAPSSYQLRSTFQKPLHLFQPLPQPQPIAANYDVQIIRGGVYHHIWMSRARNFDDVANSLVILGVFELQ